MAKLSTLQKRAQESTRCRGHRMKWGEAYGRADGPKSRNGKCRDCGAYVWLVEQPTPYAANISGLAVAVNCERKR